MPREGEGQDGGVMRGEIPRTAEVQTRQQHYYLKIADRTMHPICIFCKPF